jgi:hypothetical protein
MGLVTTILHTAVESAAVKSVLKTASVAGGSSVLAVQLMVGNLENRLEREIIKSQSVREKMELTIQGQRLEALTLIDSNQKIVTIQLSHLKESLTDIKEYLKSRSRE